MFKLLGAFVLAYTVYGLASGEIYGRYRASGRTFRRVDEPFLYWSAIASYFVLGIALIFIFGRRW
jgi:hypothetical protein